MPEVLETERPFVEPAERTETRNPSDDLEYDAEPEYRIRKKPKSFIQAPRGKGVSVATSMTDLKNENEDQAHRHKHYHTVIERTVYVERTNQNQRDDKEVQNFDEQEDKIDLRSRKARMEIIGEHAASFKVEIQPIYGDKDNYYIMTTDGTPFAKIVQNYDSGLSIESENIRFDDKNSCVYRGRDTIMSDLVNQNHNTTQIRLDDDSLPPQLDQPDENNLVDEVSVDSVNKGSSFVSNPVSMTSRPSILA